MRLKLSTLIGFGLAAGVALALLIAVANSPRGPMTVETGKPLIGGPFTLTDHTGKRVTDKDFLGRYSLIFFGYTHCPDICPSGLQVAAAALDRLGDKAKEVTPVFITLDPERDTPQKLAEYVASFDKRYVGLTGSKEEVAAAAKAYRIFYQAVPDEKTPGEYTVEHSAIFYLMGKDGTYLTHIPHTTNVDQVAKTLGDALR